MSRKLSLPFLALLWHGNSVHLLDDLWNVLFLFLQSSLQSTNWKLLRENASHKVWTILKMHRSTKALHYRWSFQLLTQGQIFCVPGTAWLVMCNQQTLTIEQRLLLDETGVPHFDFFQVTGQLRIEDYYYAVRVLHQSWPARFKPWKTGARETVRVTAGKQNHALRLPQVFFFPSQEHLPVLLPYYNISNLASDRSYSKHSDLPLTWPGPMICCQCSIWANA